MENQVLTHKSHKKFTAKHSADSALVLTCALPYANGDLHIGHALEYLIGDAWVKSAKERRREGGGALSFVCADDQHGSAITVSAKNNNVSPEDYIRQVGTRHQQDFSALGITFDYYGGTHTDKNRLLCNWFFESLQAAGWIKEKHVFLPFDPLNKVFLTDREIHGTCYHCGAPDQLSDGCQVCAKPLDPKNIIDAKTQSGGPIEWRESGQLFVGLEGREHECQKILEELVWQEDQKHLCAKWLADGLKDWDISRRKPYFGFDIPGYETLAFYVWFSAPIGYLAQYWELLEHQTKEVLILDDFLKLAQSSSWVHIIGKDIGYFHGIFWSVLLHVAGFKRPVLWSHGHLTADGKKLSKRTGTAQLVSQLCKEPSHISALRAQVFSSVGPQVKDIDYNLQIGRELYNDLVVGKCINLIHRTYPLKEKFQSLLTLPEVQTQLVEQRVKAQKRFEDIQDLIEEFNFQGAWEALVHWAQEENSAFTKSTPWKAGLSDQEQIRAALVISEVDSFCGCALRILSVWFSDLGPLLVWLKSARIASPPKILPI